MISFLYQMAVAAKQHGFPGWQYLYKLNKVIVNILYPMTQRYRKSVGVDRTSNVIVSLTSFPDRIEDVWIAIASIMNQTVKPGKIILWLSREQFLEETVFPQSLLRMQKRGLEVRFCEGDLKPHKKYFYAMQEYPDNIIITIDDDIFYPENHIEKLLQAHERYPQAVCCWYAGRITYDEQGQIRSYNDWTGDVDGYTTPTLQLLPVGCGGVLYPPHCMESETFDAMRISELCIKTDDLWLKAMEVLHGTQAVRCTEYSQIFFGLIKTRHKGLFVENADSDGNDVALRKILTEYPQVSLILYEDEQNGKAIDSIK